MIHAVLGKQLDLAAMAAEAQTGRGPGHVLLDLARRRPVRFWMPGQPVPSRIDQLRGLIFGSGELWALARAVLAQAAEDHVIFCTGEDVGIPMGALNRGRGRRVVVFGHNVSRPRARAALRIFGAMAGIETWLTNAGPQEAFLLMTGVERENVVRVPEQTDISFFTPGSMRGTANGNARPLIVAVGLECRDYRTLAAATQGMDVDVKISGYSRDARALARAFPEKLPANMTMERYSWTDLRELYRRADAVVVPLFDNAFGAGLTTMLEAMACGAPVIVSRTRGLKGYLDEGRCSVVPGQNPEGLRGALEQVLASGGDERGQEGREWVLREHAPRCWLEVMEGVFAGELARNTIVQASTP